MVRVKSLVRCLLVWSAFVPLLSAEEISLTESALQPVGVQQSLIQRDGQTVLRVIKDPAAPGGDQPTYARLSGTSFKDGTIEVQVRSRLAADAGRMARGFIGVAFRISEDNSKFECIYLRPANARADDQLRRNHSTQYFSYPDFPWSVLREATPGLYESYVDMALDEWITVRIEVQGTRAQLFVNNAAQPCLIVNDLKHGAEAKGSIGLWVDVGTEGYFQNLKVQSR